MGPTLNFNNSASAAPALGSTSDALARISTVEQDPGTKNSSSGASGLGRGKAAGRGNGSTTNKSKIPMELLPGRSGEKYQMTLLPGQTGDKVQLRPLTAPTGFGNPTSRPVFRASFQPRFQLDVDSKTVDTVRATPGGTVAQATSSSTDPFPSPVPIRVGWSSGANPIGSSAPSTRGTAGSSVAQAPGSSPKSPATLSEPELKKLNPDFKPGDAAVGRGWYDFFVSSKHTEKITGSNGVKTTKPIPLGNGLTLPVDTTVSPNGGPTKSGGGTVQGGGSMDSLSDGIDFKLPNGKTIKLEFNRDKETGVNTLVTFDDGKFFRVPGTPFFNKQTGALGRVSPSGIRDTYTGQKYALRDALVPAQIGTWPARNGAMSGSDFEAALRSALR